VHPVIFAKLPGYSENTYICISHGRIRRTLFVLVRQNVSISRLGGISPDIFGGAGILVRA